MNPGRGDAVAAMPYLPLAGRQNDPVQKDCATAFLL